MAAITIAVPRTDGVISPLLANLYMNRMLNGWKQTGRGEQFGKKTSIRNARTERFDFPGYPFGPHYSRKTGRKQMGCSPSKKSMERKRHKVSEHLRPAHTAPWEEVRDRLNQKLRGWKEYFRLGNPWKARS